MRPDYYKILEVDRAASSEVIQKAYRALSLKHHPDSNHANRTGVNNERMHLINEAYETLSDTARRSSYNQTLLSFGLFLDEGLIGLARSWMLSQRG